MPSATIDVLRLVMLNVSQSVAIDYYEEQTNKLLTDTNYYTQKLENKGRLGISGQKLKKYIGRTLLLRTRIAEKTRAAEASINAAKQHVEILIVGLLLSIAFMGVAATIIAKLLQRYHWLSYVGLVLIVYVACEMIYHGGYEVLDVM